MKNIQKYRKFLLLIFGIIILLLLCIFIYNIFKKSINIPESSTTTTNFPKILPIIPNENLINIIKPTLAQGDCFYSAIYRSLKDKNLLQKFCSCLDNEIQCNSEDDFIQSLRNFMSNYSNFEENYMGIFYNILDMKSTDVTFEDDFKAIINYLGDTRNVLKKYNDENKFVKQNINNFITDIKNVIKTRGTYVGEIEVTFVRDILEKCDISLNIIVKTDKSDKEILSEIKEKNSDKNITVILDNNHYEYV
jgi:hypothetical protein